MVHSLSSGRGYGWMVLAGACTAMAVGLTWRALTVTSAAPAHPVAAPEAATASVVVAATPVSALSPMTPSDLRVVQYPVGLVPSGALTQLNGVSGRWTIGPLAPGEPVTRGDLVPRGTLAGLVRAGEQAVGISVSSAAAAGGIIEPGDVVNLYAATASSAHLVAQNLVVLAVNSSTAHSTSAASGLLTISVPNRLVARVLEASASGSLVVALEPLS